MSKYLRLQSTAARLIKENGAEFNFQREQTSGDPDPVTGKVPEAPPLTQKAYAVILSPKYNPVEQYLSEGGILGLTKLNNILISPQTSWELKPLDQIFHQDEWWILEYLTPIRPNGTTIVLYKGFIRRV